MRQKWTKERENEWDKFEDIEREEKKKVKEKKMLGMKLKKTMKKEVLKGKIKNDELWRRKKTGIEWEYIGNEIGETEGKEGKNNGERKKGNWGRDRKMQITSWGVRSKLKRGIERGYKKRDRERDKQASLRNQYDADSSSIYLVQRPPP